MKKSKKLLTGLVAGALLCGTGAVAAFAYPQPQPENPASACWVYVTNNATPQQSDFCVGTFKQFSGETKSSSASNVYFEAYYRGYDGSQIRDTQKLVNKGTGLNERVRTKTRDNGTWFLQLDPYGIGKGTAEGYIEYK